MRENESPQGRLGRRKGEARPFSFSIVPCALAIFQLLLLLLGCTAGASAEEKVVAVETYLSFFVPEENLQIMPHLDLKHKIVFQSIQPSIPEKLAFLCFHRDVLRQSIVQMQ